MFPNKIAYKSYMLIFLSAIRTEILAQCSYPDTDDFVITNFYREKCGPCDRVMHFLDEIDSRLERNNSPLTFRYVDCGLCECKTDNIDKVPTVTVSKNRKEIARFQGFREFGDIVEFLSEHTNISTDLFKKRIESTPGRVVQLKSRDFITAFDGPWLILFYKTKSDLKRELIEVIAEENEAHLNVGEISGNSVPDLLTRFSIPALPALLAFHGGLLVGYNGADTLDNLRTFVAELLRPALPSLSSEGFTEESSKLQRGEPLFIVFFHDVNAATETFAEIAHEYRFRARIFKSDDSSLISQAHIDFSGRDLALAVYRNGVFHECQADLSNRDAVFNWIFHAHYPYLTQITNESIYTVLHGIKPVVLLLSRENHLVMPFERIAEEMHKGQPFIDKVFASIDIAEYSLFLPKMLPDLVTPSVVMLDPSTSKFYAENKRVSDANLREYVHSLVEKYDLKKLKEYPTKKSSFKKPFIIVCIICCLALLAKHALKPKLKIVH